MPSASWRVKKLSVREVADVFVKTGVLVPLCVACALVVGMLRAFGPIDAPYSWLRPVDVLSDVLASPDIVLLIVVAYTLGLVVRISAQRAADGAGQTRFDTAIDARFALRTMAIAYVLVISDLHFFPEHAVHDQAALVFAALLITARGGDLGNTTPRTMARGAAEALVVIGSLVLVSYVFTVVKSHLFHFTDARDAVIVRLESALFGDPLHTHALRWGRSHPDAVVFLDRVYFRMFYHMLTVSAFLAGCDARAMRHRYAASLCLCYLVGGLAYYVLPSMGPVFADPEAYAHLKALPLFSNDIQRVLASNTAQAEAGTLRQLQTYGFLAAMPSLHIAHELIMLFYSRASGPFFGLSALFAASTAVAVLVLGWHYALDMVGGLLLAAAVLLFVERSRLRWLPAALTPRGVATSPEA